MSAKFTPGPWLADGHFVTAGPRSIVADCEPTPLGAANAQLIAAAPELAEALRVLVRGSPHDRTAWPAGYEHVPSVCLACQGEAALRKAGVL